MVAMNSIASVMRCRRVTNISRYAIFNSLPKNKQTKQIKFSNCIQHNSQQEIACDQFNMFVGSTVEISVGELSCCTLTHKMENLSS